MSAVDWAGLLLFGVTVCCGQAMHNFPFPGMDEARAYADELAGKVNADA